MIPKPKSCNQEWTEMKPTSGGRTCQQCNKVIKDFSKSTWTEIERVQRQTGFTTCGLYSPKQLEHWGKEVYKKDKNSWSPFVFLTSLAAILHLSPKEAAARELTSFNRVEMVNAPEIKMNESATDTTKRTSEGYVYGEDKMPLLGVSVFIKDTSIGTVTNELGYFSLDIGSQLPKDSITLVFSFIGYPNQEKTISTSNPKSITTYLKLDIANITSFSVVRAPLNKRIWWSIKRPFQKK